MALDAGTRLGPYEIVAPIGAGGMGEVYKARDTRLDRTVAVKVLPEHMAESPERKSRFEREAKALSQLNHPHICILHDVGEQDGLDYLVMEYIEGETLAERLKKGALKLDEALKYGIEIADGLDKAHGAGVVHRDLKPANIIITIAGVKVVDFGLAKRAGVLSLDASETDLSDSETEARTSPGMVVGTLGYMSPEQVRGLACDARSDVFSLGATLVEMWTGTSAFSGHTAADTLSAILKEDSPVLDSLPKSLERIARRCLEKKPEERFQSARALAAALEALSDTQAEPTEGRASSIAVLPFVDMSPTKDQEYFCEGIAEELINGLSTVKGLRVAARSSAFQFKGGARDIRRVGEALNVETVLDGSVRTAGTRLRVTAQLNDAADGYQIWSKRYDRDMDDVFAVQDEIAADIVKALDPRAANAPKVVRYTENQEAYHLYLRGRYHWYVRTKEGLEKARSCHEQAIALDPDYVPALVGLADYHAVQALYGFVPEAENWRQSGAYAKRALDLNEGFAEAHRVSGWVQFFGERDFEAARRSWERASQLDPSSAIAHVYVAWVLVSWPSKRQESLASARRASGLAPLDAYVSSLHGAVLDFCGQSEAGVDECRKALDVNPDYLPALFLGASALSRLGRNEEAISALERAVRVSSRAPHYLGWLGWALARAGRTEEARAVLTELDEREPNEYVASLFRAIVHGGLGELDRGFELLRKGADEKNGWIATPHMAMFDEFRADPRFHEHLKYIGHPTA